MPKIITAKTDVAIKILSKEGYSYRKIQKKLKQAEIDVSISSICRSLKNIGIGRQALNSKIPKPKYRRAPTKRLPWVIKQLKSLVDKDNSDSYTEIEKKPHYHAH